MPLWRVTAGFLMRSHCVIVPALPNGWRLSGERSGAERVRCSRGFGESWLMSRDMAGRYAFAEMLFNVSGPASPETLETEGPGTFAVTSLEKAGK